ncbi:tRNA pseudouridine(38/39) synthase [Gracilariopsis chorda]|uniref:tRNA pseudouridine synthase n=1 Tax=Gracilariopsis chorda TaxID=448386 RepID=A0A2V3J2B0_9FLOR|nr:tRNA pseudouridine(38/39) synthase [Gracilariopsis chorda]|eukprot:PXF47530.1 tRNA pseudouridine(38/39) synthase [Gracilariopsis chorda]
MPTNTKPTEKELRSMSREELLSLALTHLSSEPEVSKKADDVEVLLSNVKRSNGEPPRKKPRHFDMSRYGQRHIALRLMYTGWRFHGFAAQADSDNTVEAHLFSALLKVRLISSRTGCDYSRAGRTDVGVSASNQVIGLRVRSNVKPPSTGHRELDYVKVLNGVLPQGIRCTAWTPVCDGASPYPALYDGDPDPIKDYWNSVINGSVKEYGNIRRPGQKFSARFDAAYRSYKYFFVCGALDIKAMRKGARYFEGTHDFRNFCRIDENITNFERHMYTVQIRRLKDDSVQDDDGDDEYTMYYIFVKGQAFLWHQVRCMAAVLFDVGMLCEDPEVIKQLLEDAEVKNGVFSKGRPQYKMAPPTPLLLYECEYPKTVLYFPQSFEREFSPPITDSKDPRRSSFERANLSIAKDFAEQSAKMSILQTILKDQDKLISYSASIDALASRKSFMQLRKPRDFISDLNPGRHIPYEKRPTDDPIEIKQMKAGLKKKNMSSI